MFIHIAAILRISGDMMKRINSIIYQFAWLGKLDKINRDLLIPDYEKGDSKW